MVIFQDNFTLTFTIITVHYVHLHNKNLINGKCFLMKQIITRKTVCRENKQLNKYQY